MKNEINKRTENTTEMYHALNTNFISKEKLSKKWISQFKNNIQAKTDIWKTKLVQGNSKVK